MARGDETASEFPKTLPPKRVPKEKWAAVVIATERGAVLLMRRKSEGLFGGLWEPPMGKGGAAALARTLGEHGLVLGDAARGGSNGTGVAARAKAVGRAAKAVGTVAHVLTHKALEVRVSSVVVPRQAPLKPFGPYEDARWVDADALTALGKSKLAQRVLGLGLARPAVP